MQAFRVAALVTVAFLAFLLPRAPAATVGVTVPSANTLTTGFVPYAAGAGTSQLAGDSPFRRTSASVGGMVTYLEDNEALTDAANLTLNWLTGRTKSVTLNQNTTFAFSNIPSTSTNIQRMVVRVIGDGTSSVAFTGVIWQTAQVAVPDAGVVTPYVLEALGGVISGYAGVGGSGGAFWSSDGLILSPSPAVPEIDFFNDASQGQSLTTTLDIMAVDDINTFNQYGDLYFRGDSSTGNASFSLDSVSGTNSTVFNASLSPTGASLRLLLNSVPTFYVDPTSGYTGTGNNLLSDDGTYKPAAMVTATNVLWASFNNNLYPDPAIRTVSIQSQSPDNATNVALVVDTAVPWTNNILTSFRNSGIAINRIRSDGAVGIGTDAALSDFGGFTGTDAAFLASRTTDNGDVPYTAAFLFNTENGAWDTYGYVELEAHQDLGSPFAHLTLESQNTNITSTINIEALAEHPYIRLVNGSVVTLLDPGVISTGSSTAHQLGTSQVLTNGDTLLSVQNAGSDRFSVDALGTAQAFQSVYAGPNSFAAFGDDNTKVFASSFNAALGDGNYMNVYFQALDGAVYGILDTTISSTAGNPGISMDLFSSANGGSHTTLSSPGQSSAGYVMQVSDTSNGVNRFVITTNGAVSIGSLTNTLLSLNELLIYTNGSSASGFAVATPGSSELVRFLQFGSGSAKILVDTGNGIFLSPDNGSVDYIASSGSFSPDSLGKSLGTSGSASRWQDLFLDRNIVWNGTTNSLFDTWGAGSPESVVAARPGSLYRDTLNGSLYIKSSGTGNTGWSGLGTATLTSSEFVGSGSDCQLDNAGLAPIVFGGGEAQITLPSAGTWRVTYNAFGIGSATWPQYYQLTNATTGALVANTFSSLTSTSNGNTVSRVKDITTAGSETIKLWGYTDSPTPVMDGELTVSTNTVINYIKL